MFEVADEEYNKGYAQENSDTSFAYIESSASQTEDSKSNVIINFTTSNDVLALTMEGS